MIVVKKYDGNEQKRKNIINRADTEDLFYDGKPLKLRTVTKMKEGDEIMFDLVKRISQRAQYLDEMIIRVRRKVDAAPENRLRIDASGTKPRYCEVDKEDTIVRYLSEKDMAQVEALAQKSYDKKVLSAACRERDVLEKMMQIYPKLPAEGIIDLLSQERQKLVIPVVPTKEEMIREFRAQTFEPHPIPVGDTGLETDRGEIVRTRAEYIIANDINRTEAQYHYEKPLFLEGWGTVYPDFTILNVRTGKIYYWEHLGMTNDPGYIQKSIRKIEAYAKNGYYPGEKLILSSETVDHETGEIRIDVQLIKQLVRKYCT